METDTLNKYLLSETAIRIWKNNNAEEQNNMLLCVTVNYKNKWLKTMVYNSRLISHYRLEEIFEESFYAAWHRFNENGKAGKIAFTETTYTAYLKQAVHRTFIKQYKNEIREIEQLKLYAAENDTEKQQSQEQIEDMLEEKIQRTLKCLSIESAYLLRLRFFKKLSYADIAKKMQIKEESCRQKMYRTKKEFKKHWKSS